MWVLVIGPEHDQPIEGGAVSVLKELGCEVRTASLWDPLETDISENDLPAVALVDARDYVDAGKAVLQRLRAVRVLDATPVMIAVTMNGLSRLDVAEGFDDFVLVPYLPAELYARIRRADWLHSEFAHQEGIKVGSMYIDLAAHEVAVDSVHKELTHQEFALLAFLAQNRGRVYSRQQLLERVWGVDYYGSSRTVDIHVRRLRMKLGRAVRDLVTVRGAGYKLRAP